MHGAELLPQLVILAGAAALGAALFERAGLPSIAGFLVVGALLGPGGFGVVDDPEAIAGLAELGVVFLLFEIGLELPLDRLRRLIRLGLITGALQVALTVAVVAGTALLLGLELRTALVLGGLVAMSSTALVMRLLTDRGELDAPHGQIALGVLLFQDLCIVPFLLVLPLLGSGSTGDLGSLLLGVLQVAAVLVGFAAASWFGLPRLLASAARLRSRDVFSLAAVAVVVGAAFLAQWLGLTPAVGGFLAGLALGATPWGHQLSVEVMPLRGVLLGVFFTAVGMLFDPAVAIASAAGVALFVLAAVVLKSLIVTGILRALGQSPRIAMLSALALAQTGEFSFVLAAAATAEGLLDGALEQIFVAGSMITLLATPFVAGGASGIAGFLGRELRPSDAPAPAPRRDHAVLLGYGLAGRNLARVLQAIDAPFAAVEANPVAVNQAQERGEDVVFGDATRSDLLEKLGVREARIVAIAITDPAATREAVRAVRRLNPEVTILARTRYLLESDPLRAAGADTVAVEELEGTIDLVSSMLRRFDVPEGAVERFTTELRDEGYALLRSSPGLALDPWLAELLEQVGTEWVEVPSSDARHTLAGLGLRAQTGASALAIDRGAGTTPNPPADTEVRGGDRLLVFGTGEALARVRALLESEYPPRSN